MRIHGPKHIWNHLMEHIGTPAQTRSATLGPSVVPEHLCTGASFHLQLAAALSEMALVLIDRCKYNNWSLVLGQTPYVALMPVKTVERCYVCPDHSSDLILLIQL